MYLYIYIYLYIYVDVSIYIHTGTDGASQCSPDVAHFQCSCAP